MEHSVELGLCHPTFQMKKKMFPILKVFVKVFQILIFQNALVTRSCIGGKETSFGVSKRPKCPKRSVGGDCLCLLVLSWVLGVGL